MTSCLACSSYGRQFWTTIYGDYLGNCVLYFFFNACNHCFSPSYVPNCLLVFRDSQDLIHRLFVCISGVADQLQTNFASDLRNILKVVFQINATPEEDSSGGETRRQSTLFCGAGQ